jgi:long-chain fatty acid transport protein
MLLSYAMWQPALAEVGPALTGITASANDATSVYWSPAGITRLDRPSLVVQSMLVRTESRFKVDESNIDGGDADNDTSYLVVPAIYYVHPINDRWSLGTSLTVPSGIGHNYGKDWSGRYLSEESDLTFVSLTGVVGFKPTDRWSIAGGPVMNYTDSTSKARINNSLEGLPDGRIKLQEDGAGFGWHAGLMYEFSDTARAGAVYRSEIDPDLSGKPDIDGMGPVLKDALRLLGVLNQHVDVDFKIPAMVQAGYYQEFMGKWSFTVDGLWLNTSSFGINHASVGNDKLFLSGEFKDAWLFSAGLKYRYRPDLAFSVGAMHMSSPVNDDRRNIALPLDRIIGAGAGVEWQWKDLTIQTNLTYTDLGNGNLDMDGGPLIGRVKGSFDQNNAVILDLQVNKRF